jgi:hypothetical protein
MDMPTQGQLDALLDDIEHNAARLRELWRWAAPSIYERPRRRGIDIDLSASKQPQDYQMKPRGSGPGSGPGDPVGDIVAATEKFRRLARHAGREIADARNRLGTALADLNDAMRLLDPPLGPEVADVALLPHPAGKRDLAQSKAAQARRGRRAQASGDYGEVTG